jgi:hypothetical protein
MSIVDPSVPLSPPLSLSLLEEADPVVTEPVRFGGGGPRESSAVQARSVPVRPSPRPMWRARKMLLVPGSKPVSSRPPTFGLDGRTSPAREREAVHKHR